MRFASTLTSRKGLLSAGTGPGVVKNWSIVIHRVIMLVVESWILMIGDLVIGSAPATVGLSGTPFTRGSWLSERGTHIGTKQRG